MSFPLGRARSNVFRRPCMTEKGRTQKHLFTRSLDLIFLILPPALPARSKV
jgi:hypothetical protein